MVSLKKDDDEDRDRDWARGFTPSAIEKPVSSGSEPGPEPRKHRVELIQMVITHPGVQRPWTGELDSRGRHGGSSAEAEDREEIPWAAVLVHCWADADPLGMAALPEASLQEVVACLSGWALSLGDSRHSQLDGSRRSR